MSEVLSVGISHAIAVKLLASAAETLTRRWSSWLTGVTAGRLQNVHF